jgi:hypothetical protein
VELLGAPQLGICLDNPTQAKETAVDKNYQTTKIDTTRTAVPEQVSIVLVEIITDLREGLLALAVGAGLPSAA